jgi:hypothetical protein
MMSFLVSVKLERHNAGNKFGEKQIRMKIPEVEEESTMLTMVANPKTLRFFISNMRKANDI